VDVALSLERRAWRNHLRVRRNGVERMFPLGASSEKARRASYQLSLITYACLSRNLTFVRRNPVQGRHVSGHGLKRCI
jgi:hypothetical protein